VEYQYFLENEAATLTLADHLAKASEGIGCIYLHGELGTGKTTLSRGIVRHFGYSGAVKSPTFTLVEPYELEACRIYHFDLYRLSDPAELEYLGVDDYFSQDSLCLVEWPEKGRGFLPDPDLEIDLQVHQKGRIVKISPCSNLGSLMTTRLTNAKQPDNNNLN